MCLPKVWPHDLARVHLSVAPPLHINIDIDITACRSLLWNILHQLASDTPNVEYSSLAVASITINIHTPLYQDLGQLKARIG